MKREIFRFYSLCLPVPDRIMLLVVFVFLEKKRSNFGIYSQCNFAEKIYRTLIVSEFLSRKGYKFARIISRRRYNYNSEERIIIAVFQSGKFIQNSFSYLK